MSAWFLSSRQSGSHNRMSLFVKGDRAAPHTRSKGVRTRKPFPTYVWGVLISFGTARQSYLYFICPLN